ncbi:hypothetical protein JHK86_024683 [Glycine max]|nr:hypothetical protein JHK86_024683 [Glycine max]
MIAIIAWPGDRPIFQEEDEDMNLLSKKSRRKPYTVVGTVGRRKPGTALGTVGRRKPYIALGTVVGAQSSKLSTLPVNKLIVLYVVFKLDESYTPSKVSIRAGDGFHNLKEIKTVELVKPTGWVDLSLSGADPRSVDKLSKGSTHEPAESAHSYCRILSIQGSKQKFQRKSHPPHSYYLLNTIGINII